MADLLTNGQLISDPAERAGLLAVSFDPHFMSNTTIGPSSSPATTSGTLYGIRLKMPTTSFSKVGVQFGGTGWSGTSPVFFGFPVMTVDGTVVTVRAIIDCTSSQNGGGRHTYTLGSPVTTTPGQFVYIGMLQVGFTAGTIRVPSGNQQAQADTFANTGWLDGTTQPWTIIASGLAAAPTVGTTYPISGFVNPNLAGPPWIGIS